MTDGEEIIYTFSYGRLFILLGILSFQIPHAGTPLGLKLLKNQLKFAIFKKVKAS